MKIVLATDGSDCAALAEVLLTKVKAFREAEIIVASAYQSPQAVFASLIPSADMMMAIEQASLADIMQSTAKSRADASAVRLKAMGLNVESVTLCGETAGSIIDLAKDRGADLIVLGGKGEGAFQGFLLGSVARNLAANSPVSVLIAHKGSEETLDQARIRLEAKPRLAALLGYDGTDGAIAAATMMMSLGDGAFERATVVCSSPLSPVPPGLEPAVFDQIIAEDRKRAGELASEGAHRLQGIAPRIVAEVATGRPATSVTNEAARVEADIVFIGASRHGFLERLVLGSVAYEIATTATCSVCIVRPKS
jgi:nucleotide-binding universal stress UspA family protein